MATEKRLIDAIALISKARRMETTDNNGIPLDTFAVPVLAIEDAPTVDAVEVVHGRWELHGNDDDCGCSYFCSNCHESCDEDWFYVHGEYRHLNYCQNCGAKMDGDGNG